jgi:hypothetical protein
MTQVVYLISIGNRADHLLVDEPVRQSALALEPEVRIPAVALLAAEDPTSVRQDCHLRHEPLMGRLIHKPS